MALSPTPKLMHEEDETDTGTPTRYVPLHRLHDLAAPCGISTPSRSSNAMTKKAKARKFIECMAAAEDGEEPGDPPKTPLQDYHRRTKRSCRSPFSDKLELELGIREKELEVMDCFQDHVLDSNASAGFSGHRLRRNKIASGRKCKSPVDSEKPHSQACASGPASASKRKWMELILEDADPYVLIGFFCKVYWPLDSTWYAGFVAGYNSESCQHNIKYFDGEQENLILSKEKIKFHISREETLRLKFKHSSTTMARKDLDFHISREETQQLKLKRCSTTTARKDLAYNEMLALAAIFDDCKEFELANITWAKLSGHAMWPAVIINESQVRVNQVLKRGGKSVPAQFVGTHDFAWLILEDADPNVLIGFGCKVYWPSDSEWYAGIVAGYNSETCQHKIEYNDGDQENLILSKELIKFYISREEAHLLKLKRSSTTTAKKDLDHNEMLALSAVFDDYEDFELGDIIWAKLTGHAMWPAVIINESQVRVNQVLKRGEKSVPVQFVGTHDFAWCKCVACAGN